MAKLKLTQVQKGYILSDILKGYKEQDEKSVKEYIDKTEKLYQSKLKQHPILIELEKSTNTYYKPSIRNFLIDKYKSQFERIPKPSKLYETYKTYATKELELASLRGNIELDQLISSIKEGIKNLK